MCIAWMFFPIIWEIFHKTYRKGRTFQKVISVHHIHDGPITTKRQNEVASMHSSVIELDRLSLQYFMNGADCWWMKLLQRPVRRSALTHTNCFCGGVVQLHTPMTIANSCQSRHHEKLSVWLFAHGLVLIKQPLNYSYI